MAHWRNIFHDFEAYERNHILNGTMGAAVNDKIIYAKGFGVADAHSQELCTMETQYEIASVTKQFTAAALLRLLYDSHRCLDLVKEALNQPIMTYLPPKDEVWCGKMPSWAKDITLHHLMTHTSGLVNYTDLDAFWEHMYTSNHPSMGELINLFKDKPLSYQPGSQFEYCNSNYTLLGQIISRLSHKSLSQYFMETFFTPLGMTSSFLPSHGRNPDLKKTPHYVYLARGYMYDLETPRGPYPEIKHYWPHGINQGDGGIISTTRDLLKWNASLYGGQVLPVDVLALMITPHVATSKEANCEYYGYGLICHNSALEPIYYHGGGIPGYRSYLCYVPSMKLSLVSFSNVTFDASSSKNDREIIRPEVQEVIQKHSLFILNKMERTLSNDERA